MTRIVWLTNFTAPYRVPVWEAIARTADLTVLTEDSEDAAVLKDRGSRWTPPDDVGFEVQRLPVVSPSLSGQSYPTLSHSAARHLDGADAVLLGGWQRPVYWQFRAAARRRGIRTVGFYESTLHTQRLRGGPGDRVRRRYFQGLDAVVTPGEAATRAVREMGVPASRIFEGFNAVDVETIHDGAVTHRRSSTTDGGGHRFLFVGELIERKGVDLLLKAFAATRTPMDTLTLVGEGPQESALRALARHLGVEDAVSFRGRVPYSAIPAAIASSHTLVLPSREEVWGLVVNEALAAGLQAVVAENCGVAPSVASMHGVWVVDGELVALSSGMAAARTAWSGWVDEPEILAHTPAAFADTFLEALARPTVTLSSGSSRPMRRLVISQPYVPGYRVPFFDRLSEDLARSGIEVVVAAPLPAGRQAAREDVAEVAAWHEVTVGRQVQVGSAALSYYGTRELMSGAHAVIVPAAASCLDTQLALWGLGRRHRKVGLWGHIDSYVKAPNRWDRAIEDRMLRHADQVFAYTDRGRDAAIAARVSPDKVVDVRNSTDVSGLRSALDAFTVEDREQMRVALGLGERRVLGYLGALDAEKRIGFLAAALDAMWAKDPGIVLLVAGRGADEGLLAPAQARGQVVSLGYVDARVKADLLDLSEALLNPGRIGLLAVEALAAGVPIITTDFPWHGPEVDYLEVGRSLLVAPNDAEGYAEFVMGFSAVHMPSDFPTIDDMVLRYANGVRRMLDD